MIYLGVVNCFDEFRKYQSKSLVGKVPYTKVLQCYRKINKKF